ncbi:hypothetical protein KGF57_003116 [Candida theae]|uniref:Uncharacterized protein n=1 Tax=Candida theae TaxID=1198502 RepID=A0AAD5FYC4_9ASCO|nr:uncharacterized protein KGF57_003116 [Candida theae]KAI5957849.1 hypothetical protein KGF57_003116 [Candida theae]
MDEAPRLRLHIVLQSNERNLQNERSLFEINAATTMKELKQAIIQRLDERQVTRTFYEQVVLSFRERALSNDLNTDESSVPDALELTVDEIQQMNNVIPITLQLKAAFNGILSREFWHDITADDRFEFPPITDQEAQSLQNEDTVAPDMAVVEPMKIVAGDGCVWHLTGRTYESISDGHGATKLVDQDDLSQKMFELSSSSNLNEKVALNTSQCIIVDKDGQQPYILLSPAGIAKVDSVFKSQKVKVVLHNSANVAPSQENEREIHPAQDDDVLQRVVATGGRFLSLAAKIALALFVLGYRPNKHIQENWIKYVIAVLVLFNIYVLFFTGENRVQRLLEPDAELARQPPATQNFIQGVRTLARTRQILAEFVNRVQNELVGIVVSRTWDFEYIMSNEPNWYLVIASNFEDLWKDALIYILSISPVFQMRLYEELHKRKRMELKMFQDKVRRFYDLVLSLVHEYNKKHTSPSFNLPEKMELESVFETLETMSEEEEKYEILVNYYKVLKVTFDVFNKLYVKHLSLSDEHFELLNREFDRFVPFS